MQDSIKVNDHTFTAYDEFFKYLEGFFSTMICDYEILFKDDPVDAWKLDQWGHMLIDF